MERPSLKRTIIKSFAYAPEVDALKDNHFTLMTSLGFIQGRIPAEESGVTLQVFSDAIYDNYRKDFNLGEDAKTPGNDGFLVLEDVTLRTPTNVTYNMKELIIFYDQIIGVTLSADSI